MLSPSSSGDRPSAAVTRATAITVSTILEQVTENTRQIRSGDTDNESGYSAESLVVFDAVTQANSNVHASSEANAQYRGMGTTVVVVMFYDDRFTVADLNVAAVLSWCKPARVRLNEFPNLDAWLTRCLDRPARRRAQSAKPTAGK